MKTSPFNPVEFLETDAEIAQYLTDAYDDADPEVFVVALGYVVKARGVSDVARKSGLNRESLYKIFSGKAKPQWGTIHALMHTLGFHIKTTL
ncbi:MAG: putative addiction module antidote protein [Mariprofundus sp.]|nr:putative addiction module antidote protein [Mariprofundus sp.]